MVKILTIFLALLLIASGVVYVSERSATHARIADNPFVWFVALKYDSDAQELPFVESGHKIEWRSRADSVLIGITPPYWNEFFILGGNDLAALPAISTSVADAYIVRIEPARLPVLLSGTFAMLHRLGIWHMPDETIGEDVSHETGIGPSPETIAALKAKPVDQKPAMVNFLRYFDVARYSESKDESSVSGREAYSRYGSVAFRTVYSIGGHLVTAGKVVEVVRESHAGPTRGEWDDIAIMQYPSQQAILSMKQVPEYRKALAHRNAGLERTRIVASLVF